MWIQVRPSSVSSSVYLPSILLTAYIHQAVSIPHSISVRQSSYRELQLPSCALTCLLNGILTDGCANETDFVCHCAGGKLVGKAAACIEQGCDTSEQVTAFGKTLIACRAVGEGTSMNAGQASSSDQSSMQPSSSTVSDVSSTTTIAPTLTSDLQSISPPAPSDSTPSTSGDSSPTGTPFAPVPESVQLSGGAKAGISIGVSFVALSIFIALGWYIRRLKRELTVIQQAADSVPDDVWGASVATAAGPGNVNRANSGSGRGRRISRRFSRDSPVSPLSPTGMGEIEIVTDNGYGVLTRKRGHVLSVVMEGENEDSSSIHRSVYEPVPGQREGLNSPLEMDSEDAVIWEMPIAITPRDRSIER